MYIHPYLCMYRKKIRQTGTRLPELLRVQTQQISTIVLNVTLASRTYLFL